MYLSIKKHIVEHAKEIYSQRPTIFENWQDVARLALHYGFIKIEQDNGNIPTKFKKTVSASKMGTRGHCPVTKTSGCEMNKPSCNNPQDPCPKFVKWQADKSS